MTAPTSPHHPTTGRTTRLVVLLGLIYLLAPGHPLSWLSGLPLGALGLTVVLAFGIVLYAASPLPSVSVGGRLAGLLGVLIACKLCAALLAPGYGLEATYFGKLDSSRPERSTEFRGLNATRLDHTLDFEGDRFPLYFFNDNLRFNYYRPDEPDRSALPFRANWRGWLAVPTEQEYRLRLTAIGAARLDLGGNILEVENRGGVQTDHLVVKLPAGLQPIAVDYVRRGGSAALLQVAWDSGSGMVPLGTPHLLSRPGVLPAGLEWPLTWLARSLDTLYLVTLILLAVLLLRAVRSRWSKTQLERPLLAVLLGLVLAYGALSSLDLRGRVDLLEGGSDFLTYETYARDIQLNGPLMTLGRPLGRGRPFFFQPFYPYVLAAMHAVTGEDLYGPVVLQVFGIGVAVVLVYQLGKRLFNPLTGALASILVLGLLGPTQLDWVARRLLSENIYFWMLPATALALLTLTRRPTASLALLSGVLLGTCVVTRGPTLLWVPPALLITWIGLRQTVPSRTIENSPPQAGTGGGGITSSIAATAAIRRTQPLLTVSIVALACAAIVALVPLRNYVVSGRAALTATNGVATMQLTHPIPPHVDLERAKEDPLYRALRLDGAMAEMVEFVRQDPAGYFGTFPPLGLYALGVPGYLEPGPLVRWELFGIVLLYAAYFTLRPAATTTDPQTVKRAGGSLSIRRQVRSMLQPTALLHSFIVLHFAVMMVFLPNSYGFRQVLPMYFFLAVFAAEALVRTGQLLASTSHLQRHGGGETKTVHQHVQRTGAASSHEELA